MARPVSRTRPPAHRANLTRFPLVPLLGMLLLAGCRPDGDAGSDAPAADVQRIASAPTQADELPAAILGDAPPPQGTAVHYVSGDTATTGYLALPEGDGPFPAVLLIHEWNGLVDRIRQTADAFAREGYVALAADLYRGRTGANPDENRALTAEVRGDMETAVANLNAAVRFLRDRDDVSGGIATMGWCFGGGIALSYALDDDGEEHQGTAVFYGRIATTDPDSLRAIGHPFYGTFARMDRGIPPEQVEQFVDALRQAGIQNDVHIYDDVGHGFWLYVDRDPDNATGPALDAWQRLKAFLDRTIRQD